MDSLGRYLKALFIVILMEPKAEKKQLDVFIINNFNRISSNVTPAVVCNFKGVYGPLFMTCVLYEFMM